MRVLEIFGSIILVLLSALLWLLFLAVRIALTVVVCIVSFCLSLIGLSIDY